MFGVSMWEVTMILLVALIALGPKQMIEVARAVGKLYVELQKVLSEARNSIDLDALLSDTHNSSGSSPKGSPDLKPPAVPDLIPQSAGSQSGPDFYADLMASSRKDEPASDQSPQQNSHPDDLSNAALQGRNPPGKTDQESTKAESK